MKRTKERIDTAGNVINPETKEVIEKNEPGYIPTKEEIEKTINLPKEPVKVPDEVKSPLQSVIEKKVNQAVINAIGKIDIGKMVEKAVNDAFGGKE